MIRNITILLSGCIFLMYGASAQENDTIKAALKEVVVTATKTQQSKKETGRTVTVITADELQHQAGKSIGEVLSELSAVYVDGSYSSPGNNLSYYLRGARNGQILVLIDGIPVNDPTDITGSYDFRHLSVDQVEQIEIVKGGMSVLYGSSAVAGVINIKTKNAGKDTVQGFAEASYSSYNTINASANVNGTNGKFRYLVGADIISSSGISAALDTFQTELIDSSFHNPLRTPFDKDPFDRQNLLVKIGYDFTPQFKISAMGTLNNYAAEIDNGEFLDDENRKYSSTEYLVALQPEYNYNKGKLRLDFSVNHVSRNDFNDSSEYKELPLFSYLNGYTNSTYIGTNIQADINNMYRFNDYIKILAGVGYQQTAYNAEVTEYGDFMSPKAGLPVGVDITDGDTTHYFVIDPYFTGMFNYKGFHLNAGARANFHNTYGSFYTYMINPFYLLKVSEKLQLKPYASIATSFKAPSLYQLYSIFGNEALTPEESITYEAGMSIYYSTLEITGVWFQRDETNSIVFGSNGYQNGGERLVNGWEFNINYKYSDLISVSAHYNQVNSFDTVSLYRIPREQWGIGASINPMDEMTISMNYAHVGDRTIFDFGSFSELDLDPYDVVNIYGSYGFLNGKLTAFAAVNNIFDAEFISITGFGIKGRNYTVGIKYKF